MNRIKHSKFKNTGLIFELLVRQVATDTLHGRNSNALRIIKKNFSSSTELGKELKLYRSLQEEKFDNTEKSGYFFDSILRARKALNETQLKREKYNLIKEIRRTYGDDFFISRISNYKIHASVYKLFEFTEADAPREYVDLRFSILEHMNSKPINREDESNVILREDKSLRVLASKILIEKFNEKYSGQLTTEQKKLLSVYINNITHSTSLKEFILKEIKSISTQLAELKAVVPNKIVRIKITEVINLINTLGKKRIIEDKDILTMLRYYQLVNELRQIKDKK